MQGFNMGRYVPPDLEGTTSFNVASGKGHPLGNRARKLKTEGALIVRFECPFPIWCTNCQPEQIIGQGVRFNAEKKKVGNYYSTPIWSFKIKHTICGKHIEVRTDPKNAEYVVVEGGRRRDTGADKILDGEIRIGLTEEEKNRLEKDGGFGVLEKHLEDKKEADTQKKRMAELIDRSERDWADPYERSRKLRHEFRVGRRQRQADEKSGEALQERFGLGLDMVAPNEEDSERAAFVEFGNVTAEETSSKPMFNGVKAARATADKNNPSRRRKVPGDEHTARKSALSTSLKGNIRTALDPFLNEVHSSPQAQWRPHVKRLKANDEQKGEILKGGNDVMSANTSSTTALVGYDSDST